MSTQLSPNRTIVRFRGQDNTALARLASSWSKFPDEPPTDLSLDEAEQDISENFDWREWIKRQPQLDGLSMDWYFNQSFRVRLSLTKHTSPFPVLCRFFGNPIQLINELLDVSRNWPFELMSWGPAWTSWYTKRDPHSLHTQYIKYSAGFGDGFGSHGVMCAFRGRGHRELVSRRWLDYGPWRTIRDETTDTTYVQFHDYQADSQTALDQAGPGWQHMGISNNGGFLQSDYPFRYEWKGNYVPDQKLFRVIVAFDGEVNEDRLLPRHVNTRHHAKEAY